MCRGNRCPHGEFSLEAPSYTSSGRQSLAVEGVVVAGLGLEIDVNGRQLLSLAQQQVAAGFKIEMQTLDQREALGGREVGQHIHAEDGVETAEMNRSPQIALGEGHEVAQARFDEHVMADPRKIGLDQAAGNACQGYLWIEPALAHCQGRLADVTRQDVDAPAVAIAVHAFTDRHGDRIGFFAGGTASTPQSQAGGAVSGLAGAQFRQNVVFERGKAAG